MTEDRLREIAFDMEDPLCALDGLDVLLQELNKNASTERSSILYAIIQRNLGPDLETLRKLWRELCALTGIDAGESPVKAVEEART